MAIDHASVAVSPLRAIAIILAHGVLRLHQRQKDLDNSTELGTQSKVDNNMTSNSIGWMRSYI
jgi:hypothetical protein